ncbi:MAG: hypothetical protein LBQ60_13745 [Bacteroidales bacterium]|jgi:hypothetical protein|nr:hypothetical protein [Bacteroidales bacterium]
MLVLLLLLPVVVSAGDSILLNTANIPGTTFFESAYRQPAAAFLRPAPYKADVSAMYAFEDRKKYSLLRDGEGGYRWGFSADGLVRKQKTAYWGKAAYRNTYTRHVRWSNVSDLERIGPYHIADTTGGNVFGEHYSFSGGFAGIVKEKYVWAIEAGYRAGNDFRRRDPRPAVYISDLYIHTGGSMPVGTHRMGMSLKASTYQQRLETKTVESNRKDTYYPMKGFGMYDRAHLDYNSSFSWLYEGKGYGASLFLLPEKEKGFVAMLDVLSEDTESFATSNKYPFFYRIQSVHFSAGYRAKSRTGSQQVKARLDYRNGKGTERVYETVERNDGAGKIYYDYRLLTESHRYTRKTGYIGIDALKEWYRSRSNMWGQLGVGLRSSEERYLSPAYHMEYTHLDLSAKGGMQYFMKSSSVLVELSGGYYPNIRSSEEVPMTDAMFIASVLPDLDIFGSSPWKVDLRCEYQYRIKKKAAWYVSGNLTRLSYKSRYAMGVEICAGIRM